jgi:hypothetical protein
VIRAASDRGQLRLTIGALIGTSRGMSRPSIAGLPASVAAALAASYLWACAPASVPAPPVALTPATTWARNAFQRVAIEGDHLPPRAEGQLVRTTSTDAQGGFAFRGLAPGAYLLVSAVSWRELGPASLERTDVAYARVSVAAGESTQAAVTRKVTAPLTTSFDRTGGAPPAVAPRHPSSERAIARTAITTSSTSTTRR